MESDSAIQNKIWWTRKARIQTEKRLKSNAFHSEVLLLWYSFFGVVVAILNLSPINTGEINNIAWVVFSVLILCMSGFIKGLSLVQRANLVKECYEALDNIYSMSKQKLLDSDEAILQRYMDILKTCENHDDKDYYAAIYSEHSTHRNPNDPKSGLSKKLTKGIICRHYFCLGKRMFMLSFFYCLPLILFIAIYYNNTVKFLFCQ